jgi:CHASE3 domain sensor protein
MAFEVYFEGDKTPQKFELLADLNMGGESKEFNLEGNEKAISKIVLVYKSIPVKKDEKETAAVEIWGLK